MDKLAFLLSEGVKNLWRHKLTSFSSIFSIFLTLIISGSLIIVSQNTSKVIEYLRDKYKIEVFFKNEITFEKVEEVVSNINKIADKSSTLITSFLFKDCLFLAVFMSLTVCNDFLRSFSTCLMLVL